MDSKSNYSKSTSPKRKLFEAAKGAGLLPFLKELSDHFGKVDGCDLEIIDNRGVTHHYGYQLETHHINLSSLPVCTRLSDKALCRVFISTRFSYDGNVTIHLLPETSKKVGVLMWDKESNMMNSNYKRVVPATGY